MELIRLSSLMRRSAAITAGLLFMGGAAAARADDACAALATLALPDTTITEARTVPAGEYAMPQNPLTRLASYSGMNVAGLPENGPNPAFCRIAATLKPTSDSDIKIEVWLPLKGWNGKFLGVGSFGWGGAMMFPAMLTGIEQGYATAATDTGRAIAGTIRGGPPSRGRLFLWRFRLDAPL